MRATDFIYDGVRLSDYGFMIADIDDSSGLGTVTTDSQRSFSNFSMFNGIWQPLSISTYKDTLRIELSIIKNPCNIDSQEDAVISLDEIREIKRWLNRPTFHQIRLLDEYGEYDGIYWNGSANVQEIHHLGACVGFRATFYTDRPFALSDPYEYTGTVGANGVVKIVDLSDEEGYLYPEITLKPLSAGTLDIVNSIDNRHCIIKDCVANEVITITPELQISTTNSRNIGKSFNWKFLRISNNYYNKINEFTFSLPCDYSFKYNPVVKAVIA